MWHLASVTFVFLLPILLLGCVPVYFLLFTFKIVGNNPRARDPGILNIYGQVGLSNSLVTYSNNMWSLIIKFYVRELNFCLICPNFMTHAHVRFYHLNKLVFIFFSNFNKHHEMMKLPMQIWLNREEDLRIYIYTYMCAEKLVSN